MNNVSYFYMLDNEIFKTLKTDFGNYLDFVKYIRNQGLDECNFYISSSKVLPRICYLEKDYVYIELIGNALTKDLLEMIDIKKRVDCLKSLHNDAIKDKNYHKLYAFLDKSILLDYFLKHWYEIPKKDLIDIFSFVYSSLEYNHQELFVFEIVNDVLIPNKHESYNKILKMKNISNIKDGKIKIYRGEASRSTNYASVEIASWTLDIKIAEFFANRFNCSEPRVYKAEINIKDILLLVNDLKSSEKEILVSVCDLQNVELIKKFSKNV